MKARGLDGHFAADGELLLSKGGGGQFKKSKQQTKQTKTQDTTAR